MEHVQWVKKVVYVLSFVAILLLASGCQGQTPTTVSTATPLKPSPTPTLGKCNSAILPGHLLLKNDTEVHELTCTPAGTIQDKVIVTGIGLNIGDIDGSTIEISLDGRFLNYNISSGDSTSVKSISQNLQTGAKHTYQIKIPSDCVSLSPNGTQVSYVANNSIMLENLITGNHRVLVQEPSENYSPGGLPGIGQPYFGQIDCGNWISDDILLFHRFIGSFPNAITPPGAPELKPNTTTLAFLREGTFVDSSGTPLITIRARSYDLAYVLLMLADGSFALVNTSDYSSLSSARPIPCPERNCDLIGFVPHSDEVFGYQEENITQTDITSPSSKYKRLMFVDAASLTVELGPTGLPAGIVVICSGCNALPELEVINWEGSPDKVTVVYSFKNLSGTKDYLALTNLQSGEVDFLESGLNDYLSGDTSGNRLLGWIP